MASRASEDRRARGRRVMRLMRLAAITAVSLVVLGAAIYASQRLEQFLIRDSRFILAGPSDYGQPSPGLKIEGVVHASRWQVQRVFDRDFGRSVFLFPLAERRREIARVSWIKDSSIVRTWPDRITVTVSERQPVAFIQIPFGPMSRFALIDADGVILEPPAKAKFDLPLLLGVRAGDSVAARAAQVREMQSVLAQLGRLSTGVSEIDVADHDDVKVRQKMDDHSVLLMLGDENFASRMQTFFDEYPAIHKRAPSATTFDLRIDDRITAVTEGGSNVS
ncbi:MAG TPA: cell division protein FtsQ/DivIB [Bryobacteraceae bacterium]|nr:cell division protein FtsQ/DivIB [Bryobacteraceae bacterium]